MNRLRSVLLFVEVKERQQKPKKKKRGGDTEPSSKDKPYLRHSSPLNQFLSVFRILKIPDEEKLGDSLGSGLRGQMEVGGAGRLFECVPTQNQGHYTVQ